MTNHHHRARMAHWAARLVVLAAFSCSIGCSSSKISEVSGTVLLRGKPVTGGTIKVLSANGAIRDTATISADGKFVLTRAPMGEVKVAVEPPVLRGFRGAPVPRGAPKPPLPAGAKGSELSPEEIKAYRLLSQLPKAYRNLQSTPLKVTFDDGGGTISIELVNTGS